MPSSCTSGTGCPCTRPRSRHTGAPVSRQHLQLDPIQAALGNHLLLLLLLHTCSLVPTRRATLEQLPTLKQQLLQSHACLLQPTDPVLRSQSSQHGHFCIKPASHAIQPSQFTL